MGNMSKLEKLYDACHIPMSDRILTDKNILIVIPTPKHDIGNVLQALELSPFEVALTWPKANMDTFEEVDAYAINAKLVIQVDCQLSRKYVFVDSSKLQGLQVLKDKVSKATADLFVGLHHHDEFSIRDGLGTVEHMIRLLKAQKRSFCCITNHGSVGGWIKQYNACKKAGIKAIFGCLLPDQPIVTKMGVKRIQDVVVGDEVLTHKGRFKKVLTTSVRDYDGEIYSPEFWGNGDCWVTEEHPFLSYVGGLDKIKENGSRNDSYDWKYGFKWLKACDIHPNHIDTASRTNASYRPKNVPVKGRWTHYAVVPRVKTTAWKPVLDLFDFVDGYISDDKGIIYKKCKTAWYCPTHSYAPNRFVQLDEEWMRLFGLYISEGSSGTNGSIRWTFNLQTDCDSIEFVRRFCKDRLGLDLMFSGYASHKDEVSAAADFYVCDMLLYKVFREMFGHGAKSKKFPASWILMP